MQNEVKLIGYYGSDQTHACSAWTSTYRELTDEKIERIPALLKQLAEQGHHTPFEKSSLHFLVTCDTASHIHLLKHRIGVSINGESARYKELKDDKFYIPPDWPSDHQFALRMHMEKSYKLYHECIADLQKRGYTRKRAKESARFFLPYANQTTLDIQFNWRSFHHFLSLRLEENAQKEIENIAGAMLTLVRETHAFDATIAAFGWDKL